jgi:hypothetical protein
MRSKMGRGYMRGLFVFIFLIVLLSATFSDSTPEIDLTIDSFKYIKGDILWYHSAVYINDILVYSLPLNITLTDAYGNCKDLVYTDYNDGIKRGNISLDKTGKYTLRSSAGINGDIYYTEKHFVVEKPEIRFELEMDPILIKSSPFLSGKVNVDSLFNLQLLLISEHSSIIPICDYECDHECIFDCFIDTELKSRTYTVLARVSANDEVYIKETPITVSSEYLDYIDIGIINNTVGSEINLPFSLISAEYEILGKDYYQKGLSFMVMRNSS